MDELRREEPMGGAAGGLQGWRIVVVNDDGIDAPGIELLAAAARQHSDDVWIVAPAHDQSARGRAMSHRKVVHAEARGERRYAVHGTPVDCVYVGLHHLCPRVGSAQGSCHGHNGGKPTDAGKTGQLACSAANRKCGMDHVIYHPGELEGIGRFVAMNLPGSSRQHASQRIVPVDHVMLDGRANVRQYQ